jgi:hypothetical protein
MNKQEMKALALSKVEDKINMIINNINNNIKSLAEDGFFMYSFNYTEIAEFGIIDIVLQDFSSRGFSIERFMRDDPIVSIGWFRK